jgi:hypothetical protein
MLSFNKAGNIGPAHAAAILAPAPPVLNSTRGLVGVAVGVGEEDEKLPTYDIYSRLFTC